MHKNVTTRKAPAAASALLDRERTGLNAPAIRQGILDHLIYSLGRPRPVAELGLDLDDLLAQEEEPGLGNGGLGRLARVSLIDEAGERRVRMAHLATVGSHAVNGVAALHTELLKQSVL